MTTGRSHEPTLHFGLDEFVERLAKTRAAMQQAELDVIVVSDPSNMAWLTGYDGWSFYTPQSVVIGPTGGPIWFGRYKDSFGALRTTYLPSEDIIGYPDQYVMSTERHASETWLIGLPSGVGIDCGSVSRWTATTTRRAPITCSSSICPKRSLVTAPGS